MKHIHHDLIAEWIKDTTRPVQLQRGDGREWEDVEEPRFTPEYKYRFKPQPKPDVVKFYKITPHSMMFCGDLQTLFSNLRLTFDGETGKLNSAEVLT